MSPEDIKREQEAAKEKLVSGVVQLRTSCNLLPSVGGADADSNWTLREKLWEISNLAFIVHGHVDTLRYWDEVARGDRHHYTQEEIREAENASKAPTSSRPKKEALSTSDALNLV